MLNKTFIVRPTYRIECNQLKKAVQLTYSRSDKLTFSCIRPTKVVHLCIQPAKVVHPPTKVNHPTYLKCCASDLNQLKKAVQPTFIVGRIHLTFF